MKRWRKPLVALGIVLLLLVVLFLVRVPILRAVGNALICEDKVDRVEAMFVLSGGALDRGSEAARLYHAGIANTIVCTGENIPDDLHALGLDYPESEITKRDMMRSGVPDSAIVLLQKGTSTREEGQYILQYCQQHHLKRIMVVSDKVHTRRINRSFRANFEQAGITLLLHGAPSSSYNEATWWQYEYGLLAVNNEWIKIGYYWWKY